MASIEPLVSVIVPAYNRVSIIGDTIENVLQQTYPNIELIIVDDGSTDGTQAILESYRSKIRWTTQINAGPAAARNRGIAMARGEIVAFQDSDDAWHPSKIARQVSLLERGGESVVCCVCNCIVELPGVVVQSFENAPLNPPIAEGIWLNPSEVLTTRFILFNQAVAIRRKVLEKLGGFDESFRLMEDMELALRLSLAGPWTFIREPLATRQDKLPRTLGHEATPRIVTENEVRIREKILGIVSRDGRLEKLRPLMERELKSARRRLRAVHLQTGTAAGVHALGWSLSQFERFRSGLRRRSPWFPKMEVERV